MKVAIHQPQYFPWAPYVHKVISADIFVYLDNVQFSKNGVQNRNQIKTSQGACWLTVPVRHSLGSTIQETRIADTRATRKHWKSLIANYSQTDGFLRWREELSELLNTEASHLSELAISSTDWMLEKLNIKPKRIRASELPDTQGQSSQLIASICQTLGATEYMTGTGALAYLQESDFDAINCRVMVQRWQSQEYPQAHPRVGFVPNLSCLDLLLNCPDNAGALIQSAGSWTSLSKS